MQHRHGCRKRPSQRWSIARRYAAHACTSALGVGHAPVCCTRQGNTESVVGLCGCPARVSIGAQIHNRCLDLLAAVQRLSKEREAAVVAMEEARAEAARNEDAAEQLAEERQRGEELRTRLRDTSEKLASVSAAASQVCTPDPVWGSLCHARHHMDAAHTLHVPLPPRARSCKAIWTRRTTRWRRHASLAAAPRRWQHTCGTSWKKQRVLQSSCGRTCSARSSMLPASRCAVRRPPPPAGLARTPRPAARTRNHLVSVLNATVVAG